MKRAFLFTGQGSQFAGMGADLAEKFPVARETFEEADEVLGEPLSRLCFMGPEDRLAMTENTQPATLTVSLAAYRVLDTQPDVAAGHSLGEYTALTAAGVFSFPDVLRLVRQRAQHMQSAVPIGEGGMVVLRKMELAEVEKLVGEVNGGVCEIANVNAPGQIVVSGETPAMDAVVELAGPRRALRLEVSVPFHCSLLREAGKAFAEVLDDVEMKDPAFPVYCNVDAAPVRTAEAARDALARQFAGAVRWQESIERILRDEGVRHFVECGPKPVLSRMVVQIAKGSGVDGVETTPATTAEELAGMVGP